MPPRLRALGRPLLHVRRGSVGPKRRSAEAIARRRAKATEWRRKQRRRQREAELANAAPVPTPPAAEPRTVRKRRVQYHHLPHQPAVDSTVYRQYGRRA